MAQPSLFFLPSSPYGNLDLHQSIVIPGAAIQAGWIIELAGALLAERQAEADRIAAAGHAEAAARRAEKIAQGFNPDDSLIEKLRARLDLESILTSHGYDKSGQNYRHPASTSGAFGANIKILGGIERVFSHNSNDVLHKSNLPTWCAGVTAIDAFDVTVILDYGGDRGRALKEMAEAANLNNIAGRKAVAGLIFKLIRRNATQEKIEAAAYVEGERHGLSHGDVIGVATWVVSKAGENREAV